MADNHDTHLCRMAVQQAAERAERVVKIKICRDDSVIDAKPVAVNGRAKVEGTDAAVPLFRQRLFLCDGVSAAAHQDIDIIHTVSCTGIMGTGNGELANECLVWNVSHPVLITCQSRKGQDETKA